MLRRYFDSLKVSEQIVHIIAACAAMFCSGG